MKIFLFAIFFLFLGSPLYGQDARKKRLSDNQIKKRLIKASIAEYEGNCPCPYSRKSNGHRCGKGSAWSKPGGESPLCYKSDVTKEMVDEYRENNPDE